MEQSVSNNEPTNPNPKPHPLTALAFMEIGLFEIVFVIVGVLLLLGTINYFNLLPVSEVFPKYLGWLPRQQIQAKIASQGETLQPQRDTPSGTSRPTPTLTVSLEIAQNILTDFLPQVLNPSFIPIASNISLKRYEGANNNFNATWINPAVNVIFVISQKQKNLDSVNVYLTEENNFVPSIVIAENLTSKFFSLKPMGVWGCKILASKGIYCENFWEDSSGVKIGLGLQQPSVKDEDKGKKVIFLCQYARNSEFYSWKSCDNEFADTGI